MIKPNSRMINSIKEINCLAALVETFIFTFNKHRWLTLALAAW